MQFTNKIIENSLGKAFISKTQSPTVTLPRIKSLISGSLPSFFDFIENFNSNALQFDSIIFQFFQHKKKIVFYGDDTWVSLFPENFGFFERFEGTTSFFVKVFYFFNLLFFCLQFLLFTFFLFTSFYF